MAPQVNRLENMCKKRWAKYIGVGGLNTIVGYGLYAALLLAGLPYLWALFFATILGVIFNYFSIGRLVFRSRGGWLAFGKFIFAYALTYVTNAAILSFSINKLAWNAYISQLLSIAPTAAISWILMKHWVYKGK